MPLDYKFDFQSEEFNRYFSAEMAKLRVDQKADIPPEILAKVFLKGGKITTKTLNYLLMFYLLHKGAGKNILTVVADDEKGMSVAEFDKFKKLLKKGKTTQEFIDTVVTSGDMVLGNSELMGWLSLINSACMSPAYKYALVLKNTSASKVTNKTKEFFYFCNLLMNYEGNKRRIIKQEDIAIPELYVLYYLAEGREKRAVPLFNEVYRHAINASRKQIFDALKKLRASGYVVASGGRASVVYKITSSGRDKLFRIIHKYVAA